MGNSYSACDTGDIDQCYPSCTFHNDVYEISNAVEGGPIVSLTTPAFNGICSNIVADESQATICDTIEEHSVYMHDLGDLFFDHHYMDPELAGDNLERKQSSSGTSQCPSMYHELFPDFDIGASCCACGGGEMTCMDYETPNTDIYNADCRWYAMAAYFDLLEESDCGMFDRAGFNAKRDCCACGGGVRPDYQDHEDSSRPSCVGPLIDQAYFAGTRQLPANVFRKLEVAENLIRDQPGHCQMPIFGHNIHLEQVIESGGFS